MINYPIQSLTLFQAKQNLKCIVTGVVQTLPGMELGSLFQCLTHPVSKEVLPSAQSDPALRTIPTPPVPGDQHLPLQLPSSGSCREQ